MTMRTDQPRPRGSLSRAALRIGLPVAVVMAAALAARAYDTTWIKAGAPIDAVTLKAMFDEIQAHQAGTAPCPVGYVKDANVMNFTVCKGDGLLRPAADEMVKVGSGLSAFWIDRYEASVWSKSDGTGMQYAATDANGALVQPDYPVTFRKNGQRDPNFTEAYAVSKAGVQPSGSLTWFQAQQACRASGKRLPSDEEWLAAEWHERSGGEQWRGRGLRDAGEWAARDSPGHDLRQRVGRPGSYWQYL